MASGPCPIVYDAILAFPGVEGVCLPVRPGKEQVSTVVEGNVCEILIELGGV
jgi:hypothetical protein